MNKKHLVICLLIFIISFFLYSITSGTSVSFGDSGEFICGAYNFSQLHPPGYPLYSILGKIFTLFPAGEIAWRVNMMSVFFASLTLVFLYIITFHVTEDLFSSLMSVIIFMFSLTFWTYSHFAKGYTLNLFLLSVLIFCAWKYKDNSKYLYLWGITFGLSLTYHYQSMIILIPAFFYMFFITKKPSIKEMSITLLLIITGLTPYLFLPLRAIHTPEHYHWGNPTTISGFIEMVTGKIYGWHNATERTGITHTVKQLKLYGTFMIKEFNCFGILLGLSGCIFLAKKHLKMFIFTLIIYITNVFLISYLISTEIELFLEAILPGFFLPSHLIFSLWTGYSVFEISKKIRMKPFTYILLLVPFLSLIFNYHLCDQSNNYIASDFAKNCLLTPENNSILITAGDNDTFPLWYVQQVEHMRQDIKILSIGLIGEPYYHKYLKDRMNLKLDDTEFSDKAEFLVRFIQKNRDRKIYLTYHGAVKLPPSIILAPRGILYEVLSPNKINDLNICSSLFEKTYLLRGITDKSVYKDLLTSTMMGPYAMGLYELGVLYMDGNMPDKAEKTFKTVRNIDYSERHDIKEEFDKALDLQEAHIALIKEKYDKALHLLEGEEEFLKNNPAFYLVRAGAYRGKKDYNKAFQDINYALTLDPKSAKAYLELGKLHYEQNNIKEAIYKIAIALQLDPALPTGHYWLGQVYAKCNLKEKAIEEYGKELNLNNTYAPATEGIKEILKTL